jgi:AcrR family transcriptional regulator
MNEENMTEKEEKLLEAERKRQILQAALVCFMEKGYYQTTMDDIVKASKLSKGALYWYFESKEQILEDAMTFWFNQFTEEFKPLLDNTNDYRKTLKRLGDEIFDEVIDHKMMRGMFFEYISHAARKPELQDIMANYYREWFSLFAKFFENGVKAGQFKFKKIRPVVEHLGAIMEGSMLIWMIAPDQINPKSVWQTELDLILNQ